MGVKLAAASGGSIELVPTNTASAFTVTVPAVTGTMLTNKTAGTVLQVVNATYSTLTTTASASLVDTGLSASITPSSTSNKIIVLVNLSGVFSNSPTVGQFTITDGSNNILFGFEGLAGYLNTSGSFGCASTTFSHSPSTTSSFTYKVRMLNVAGTGIAINGVTSGSTSSTITLMEIAA